MPATYELWDIETANLIGTYETEDAALSVVRQAIETHGQDYVASLALGSEDKRGRSKLLAKGAELPERARPRLALGAAAADSQDLRAVRQPPPDQAPARRREPARPQGSRGYRLRLRAREHRGRVLGGWWARPGRHPV